MTETENEANSSRTKQNRDNKSSVDTSHQMIIREFNLITMLETYHEYNPIMNFNVTYHEYNRIMSHYFGQQQTIN